MFRDNDHDLFQIGVARLLCFGLALLSRKIAVFRVSSSGRSCSFYLVPVIFHIQNSILRSSLINGWGGKLNTWQDATAERSCRVAFSTSIELLGFDTSRFIIMVCRLLRVPGIPYR